MGKRLTDTEKWKKSWFRLLTPKMKCMWSYVCDVCDVAGIWDEDYETASHFIGEKVTREEFESAFGKSVVRVSPSKLFLIRFIPFQYGTVLREEQMKKGQKWSTVHKGIVRVLDVEGLPIPLPGVPYPLPKGPVKGPMKGPGSGEGSGLSLESGSGEEGNPSIILTEGFKGFGNPCADEVALAARREVLRTLICSGHGTEDDQAEYNRLCSDLAPPDAEGARA